jgi:chromosome partitioning protein
MANHTLVMRGSLHDFELLDVLQCVGTSRQHTIIELQGTDGRRKGTIAMKAGQVLTVEHGARQGRPAFFELLDRIPETFVVYRLPAIRSYPRPLGPLTNLLFEAAERVALGRSEPVLQAMPTVATAPPTVATVAPTERVVTPRPQTAPIATPQPPAAESPPIVTRLEDTNKIALAELVDRTRSPVVVAVASPKGGVGKTTITLNLALSLAEKGLRTVVVDADINGDLLSMLNAQGKVERGAYDILDHLEMLDATLRSTAEPRLRVLPARGPCIPLANLLREDLPAAWGKLIERLSQQCDIVRVDCPAGMFHATQSVLRSASHLVGVFQADMVACRSFPIFLQAVDALPEGQRPKLAGVVVNMFQGRAEGSMEAFHELCVGGEEHRIFDTTIPRSDVFSDANLEGMPIRVAGEAPSPVAFLFDMLADEVCTRVGVSRKPQRPRPRSFLL